MFGTSGIRGPVGEEVTASLALSVGHALGVDADRVVVGRDARESGVFLADALAAGLQESGTDVVDLGLAATPTVARAVRWEGADAGVSVTASHNPPPDNGLKLWQPSGQAYDESLRDTVADRVRKDETALATWNAVGERTRVDRRRRHASAIADAVALEEPPRVAVDLGNGVGGVTVDALRSLDCPVETLNAQPDGSFPARPSEPTAENCRSLRALVRESDAALGIAHDGDADRMRAVLGDGTFVSGDELLAVFARDAAEAGAAADEGQSVAVPVDTSLAVEDFLADAGVEVTYTPVGDVYVAAAASESGVAFGGEPSGAWIWPIETLCPDGPFAACKLVELHERRPLGERVAAVPDYPIRRESLEVPDKGGVIEDVQRIVDDEFDRVERIDGVRVDLGDAWFLIRASGTQPLVRVTAQARDADEAQAVLDRALAVVDQARK